MNELQDDEQGVTGKVVIEVIFRYKILFLSVIFLITTLAGIFAYLKQDIYRAHTSIQLLNEDANKGNVLSVSLGGEKQSSYDQIALLKSSLMLTKVLQKLDLGTRYFYNNKLKKHEMYKQSPFIVDVISMEPMMFGKPIYIEPVDKTHFRLRLKDTGFSLKKLKKLIFSKPAPILVFSQEYSYGELITTPWFKIKVKKLSNIGNKEYYFTNVPNIYMLGMIANGLSAGFPKRGSSVLQMSYNDVSPLRAEEIINAVTQTYFEDEISEKLKATNKGLDYLDTQLAALTKLLNKSASKLRTFKQSNTDVILIGATETKATTIAESEIKLRELEFKENILSNLKIYMDSNKDLSSISLSESEFSDESLTKKLDEFQTLNEEHRRVLTVYTEFHPEVIKVADEINRAKQSIKFLVDSSIQRTKNEKKFLIDKIKRSQDALVSLPVKENQLAILSRNFEVNEKIYSFLLEKRTEMQILYSSTTPNVRILDKATSPSSPFKPNRNFIVITGMVLGALLGFAIAFILYLRDDTIKEVSEIENGIDIPFFGLIPHSYKGKYTIAYEEAFRALRTNLEFVQVSKPSKKVLVASSISGEGKSTGIKNMAEMLVKLNKKVIVLDFDLRRPSLHKYFKGIHNDSGLSMLLSAQCNLQECIQKTRDNLDLIAAGPISPNPSELIMSEATELLLQTLDKTYDYILIDTPPYSVVTDATILMKKVDIVLFSIMQEHSKRDCIKNMKSIITKFGLKTTGIIYHGVKLKKSERHGYGYYEVNKK